MRFACLRLNSRRLWGIIFLEREVAFVTRWHVIFSGRVQHVGFRYTACYFTRDLYLTGWVNNRSDGTVEMEVQGGPLQLQRLLSRLKGQFDIDRAEVTKIDPVPHERGFRVRGY